MSEVERLLEETITGPPAHLRSVASAPSPRPESGAKLEPGPNGWGYGYASEELREEARALLAEGDRHKVSPIASIADPEHREQGYLGELMFREWLRARKVPHVHDGGSNANPDFTLDGRISVGVKTVGSRGEWQLSHHVYVFRRQLNAKPDEWFFLGHERDRDRHVYLGGIRHELLVERARVVPVGEEICRGLVVRGDDAFTLRAHQLTPPGPWIDGALG